MKTFNILLFALLFLFPNAYSQNFSAGVHGGINYSNITKNKKSTAEDFLEYKNGYKFGANLEYRISELVGVRTELNVERKGTKSYFEPRDIHGNSTFEESFLFYNFDYYSLPLILQLHFGKEVRGLVQVGTEFSYLKKQTNVYDGYTLNGILTTFEDDQTEEYSRFDQGILLGLGMSIPINERFSFRLMARTALGVKSLNAIDQPAPLFGQNISHSVLLGLQYDFIKKSNS